MSLLKTALHFSFTRGMVIILSLLQIGTFAQQPTKCDYVRPHEADNWAFGNSALLDFNQGFPEAKRLGTGNLDIPYGCAAISDEEGNLLFFSDGIKIYTNGYYMMSNGDELGGIGPGQTSLFIPAPGNKDKVYLFTVQMFIKDYYFAGIKYSVIEKNNGLWNITDKNHVLYNKPNAQKITAVKQKNQIDYWIIIHGYGAEDGNKFYVYQLTEDGLDLTPYKEVNIGSIHNSSSFEDINNNGGYMKVSPDGSKLALVIPYDGIIEVFDFDNETGNISAVKSSKNLVSFIMPNGIEFSPDNKKLYLSTGPLPGEGEVSKIYQFLLEGDVFSNYTTLFDYPDATELAGAMQLGADGRIYIATALANGNPSQKISVINNPNREGMDCNFELNSLSLFPVSGSLKGLPNFVTSFLDIPHFSWVNHCATEITYFNLRNETNVGAPTWDFGDGGATSNALQSNYIYTQPGNYTVSVTENYNGISYPSFERNITIHPLPPVELGDPVLYILPGSSVTLDAGEFDEYLWEPDGSTERYIDVSEEGIYKVTVTDTNCCLNEDQIEIKLAKIYFPTAFKPTSSVIENATFKCLGDITAMLNFNMKIFNRWGQMVFSSDDPDKGWDGTFSGGDAEVGVYVWVINYSSTESRYQTAQSSSQRGTVTLLR